MWSILVSYGFPSTKLLEYKGFFFNCPSSLMLKRLCTTMQSLGFAVSVFNEICQLTLFRWCLTPFSLRFTFPTVKAKTFTGFHTLKQFGSKKMWISHNVCWQPRPWVSLFMRKSPCIVCPMHMCWVGVGEVDCWTIYIVLKSSQQHKAAGLQMKLSTVIKGTEHQHQLIFKILKHRLWICSISATALGSLFLLPADGLPGTRGTFGWVLFQGK